MRKLKNDSDKELDQKAAAPQAKVIETDAVPLFPLVLYEKSTAMEPIEHPEKGTGVSETTRNIVDGALSAVPFVGGALVSLGRQAVPSKRDRRNSEWQSDVTEAVNRNSSDIVQQKQRTDYLEFEQEKLRETVGTTLEKIDQLSLKESSGITEIDPLDGELAAYKMLVDQERFQTVLTMLRVRFDDMKSDHPLTAKTAARVISLKAICLKGLGEQKQAADLFIEASKLDPQNLKHRSNLVVAYLILERHDEAEACVQGLIADDPQNAMHWANLIYVRSASGGKPMIDEVPAELRHTKDVCLAHLMALRMRDDPSWPEVARASLALHPNSQMLQRAAAEADLQNALTVAMRSGAEFASGTSSEGMAQSAAEKLLSVWKKHIQTEAFATSPDMALLNNLLMALRFCKRTPEVKDLVQANINFLLEDEASRIVLAGFAIDVHDEELLDLVLEKRFPGDAPARLERALQAEDWALALEMLEINSEDLNGYTRIDVGEMAGLLRASLEPSEKRAKALTDVLSEVKPDPHTYLVACRIAERLGEDSVSDEAFKLALAQNVLPNKETRFRLASECMNRDQPAKAIEILEGHVDPLSPSSERRTLALAYASSAVPVASGIDFFRNVHQAKNGDEEIQRAGGHFHLNRRRPEDAIPWFRRALSLEPNKARTQLALWQALARGGKAREMANLLANVDLGKIEGELRDQMDVAQLLWRSGRREALDHAYEIAARSEDNLGVCQSYVGLILGDVFGSKAPPIPESDVVSSGSFVRLSRHEGDPFEFVVVGKDDNVHFHLSETHPIVSAALGRRVGEEFETEAGPNRFRWRIEEIKSKYLHLFHHLSHTIQDRFPDRAALWSVTIKDDDLTPILESVKARQAQIERVEALYLENPMPLAAVASAGGGNAIDFALHLAQSGKEMFSATGRSLDSKVEAANARRAIGAGVVVDTYTGWLLSKLSILDKVCQVYGKILVPASIIDEIAAMTEEFGGSEQGRLVATSDNGKLVAIQHTAQEVSDHLEGLRAVAADLKEGGSVVGIEMSGDLDPKLPHLAEFLGTQFDSLSVAHREKSRILSADLRMRQVATGVFGIEAFGMDAMLDCLTAQKLLSDTERASALLTLAALRHSFIGLNAPTLIHMMMIDGTNGMIRFQRASEYFGGADADIASHVKVAAAFSSMAFGIEHPRHKAEMATGMLLRSLIRFRGIPLSDVINSFVRLANRAEITSYVVSWLQGHFLMDLYQKQMNER